MQPEFRPDRLAAPAAPAWTPRWWAWPLGVVMIFVSAAAGLHLTPEGSALAAWWPGAGVSVLCVLLAGPRHRWAALAVVLVTTGAANAFSGREVLISVLFAIANTAEAATVALLLHRRGRPFRLGTTRDAVRFVLAVVAGAAVIGLLAGASVAAVDETGFADAALHAATSHAAAVLLIAPFAVLPPRLPDRTVWPEVLGQSALMALTVAAVFAPGTFLPLSFLPFAFMAWAALRFPVEMALAQMFAVSLAALWLTLAGGGPFAAAGLTTFQLVTVVEAYMIVLAVFTVLLTSARYELKQATRTALAVSHLIAGGFVDSRVGLVIAEDADGAPRVLWANRAANRAIGAELDSDGRWDGPLARNAHVSMAERVETMYDDPASGATISLVANRIAGDESRFAAQLVDVTATIRMAQARRDAERERDAAHRTRLDLERQREDFVATTGHELRTPITSIAGYAELLRESPALGPLEQSWVKVITRNTTRLAELADDLLTLVRTQTHPGVQPARTVPLHELVADVVTMHRPMAEAKDLRFTVAVADETTVRCAYEDASRCLDNVVANAIKFTPAGGAVHVAEVVVAGRLGVRVTDTGPGMAPESLAHALERFYRGPDTERESTPGTGLGLAIAAELAARNGGEVHLASPPGGGLEVTLLFREQPG